MPYILPTADELARMSWHQREKCRKRAVAQIVPSTLPVDEPLTRPKNEPKRNRISEATEEWAANVRQEARELLAWLPADPNAKAHRLAAMEAVAR